MIKASYTKNIEIDIEQRDFSLDDLHRLNGGSGVKGTLYVEEIDSSVPYAVVLNLGHIARGELVSFGTIAEAVIAAKIIHEQFAEKFKKITLSLGDVQFYDGEDRAAIEQYNVPSAHGTWEDYVPPDTLKPTANDLIIQMFGPLSATVTDTECNCCSGPNNDQCDGSCVHSLAKNAIAAAEKWMREN